MGFPGNIFYRFVIASFAIACLLSGAIPARSQVFDLESAGVRYGFPVNKRTEDFKQSEAFVNWNLPWSSELFKRWHLQWRLDTSAGWLGGNGTDAFVGAVGPSLLVRRDRLPLSWEFGSAPTLLSRDRFGTEDFGTLIQFTTYAGMDVNLGRRARLGYRFQHMSNAHLDGHNPGLNMHMFQVSWRF